MKTLKIFMAVFIYISTTASSHIVEDKDPPLYISEMRAFGELLKEGEPAFTVKEAASILKEMIFLVEEATGKKFNKLPKIKLIDRKEISKVLGTNAIPKPNSWQRTQNDRNTRPVFKADRMVEIGTLGLYGIHDNILYLIPRNLIPILKIKNVEEKYGPHILKFIIAHELVHVLQDQEFNLAKRYRECKGFDESEALFIAVEGHAVFIGEKIAQKLKIESAFFEFSKILTACGLKFNSPVLEMSHQEQSRRYEYIYLIGKQFIEYHYKRGGNKWVWQILANPPASTEMIFNPENYSSIVNRKFDPAILLADLDVFLGEKLTSYQNYDVPIARIWSNFTGIDNNTKHEIITGIAHIQNLTLKDINGSSGHISLVLLKDESIGNKVVKLMEDSATADYNKETINSDIQISDLHIGDWNWIIADLTRKLTFIMLYKGNEEYKFDNYNILQGKVKIEISVVNNQLNERQVLEIAKEIFMRYSKAKRHGEDL